MGTSGLMWVPCGHAGPGHMCPAASQCSVDGTALLGSSEIHPALPWQAARWINFLMNLNSAQPRLLRELGISPLPAPLHVKVGQPPCRGEQTCGTLEGQGQEQGTECPAAPCGLRVQGSRSEAVSDEGTGTCPVNTAEICVVNAGPPGIVPDCATA